MKGQSTVRILLMNPNVSRLNIFGRYTIDKLALRILAEEAVIHMMAMIAMMTVRDVLEAVIAVIIVNLDSPLETIVRI